jgi:hypothetical protein
MTMHARCCCQVRYENLVFQYFVDFRLVAKEPCVLLISLGEGLQRMF